MKENREGRAGALKSTADRWVLTPDHKCGPGRVGIDPEKEEDEDDAAQRMLWRRATPLPEGMKVVGSILGQWLLMPLQQLLLRTEAQKHGGEGGAAAHWRRLRHTHLTRDSECITGRTE